MAAAAGVVVSIIDELPSAAAAAAGEEVHPLQEDGEGERGGDAAAADYPEKQLARFVRYIVLLELAGNGFGAVAIGWATTVLLGGFSSTVLPPDFFFVTILILIDSVRVFFRYYKLNQYHFGTIRALRWINSSFPRMLVRPQQGNQVVLIMGLWLNLIHEIPPYFGLLSVRQIILTMALLILRPIRPWNWKWHMRVVAIAYLPFAAYKLVQPVLPIALPQEHYYNNSNKIPSVLLFGTLPVIIEAGAVLLLNLSPQGLANLSTPCGRRLISLAKVTSALMLAAELVVIFHPLDDSFAAILSYCLHFNTSITMLVLSLGSLQNHPADGLFGRCTDAILHILLLLHFVLVPFPGISNPAAIGLSFVVALVLLLIGNLQIPATIMQIVLSFLRLSVLHIVYTPQLRANNPNMLPALLVFYLLVLCQAALYIMASILGLFSSFPRRRLIQMSKFGAKLGSRAIDLYYERAYMTLMEMGVFGGRTKIVSFADFAIGSLSCSSSSLNLQVAALCVVHNILERRDESSKYLIHRLTSSSIAVSTLVGMLVCADLEDDDSYRIIRQVAARVTAELAVSLRISSIPGMLKSVSTLLTLAENTNTAVVPNQQQRPGAQQTPLAIANGGWWNSSAICGFWQRMKREYWSVPEEPTMTHTRQDSPLVVGMAILEKLARDLDNRVEIFKDDTTNLISKTVWIIGLATGNNEQNDELVRSSLEFLRRLATTGERIGEALRQELWKHPFLLTFLARVLEDDRSSSSSCPHELWEPAMDIIAKLALDSAAGPDIVRNQVITARLLHVFLGRHGPTNDTDYDRSLRKVSGEALANLALWGAGTAKCILDEPRNDEVISDLKNKLSDDENRYVAASLLLNLCAHCCSANVNLLLSHPRASEHLSSALTIMMRHIMAAEGNQLECLINLASKIGDVSREAFVRELESQTSSGAELVQKLLCTLNSKNIPHPECPKMRRVIVKIVITILRSCHDTVEKLIEEGMMEQLKESLTKIEKTPSRVEEYRVFYGNIGVVREDAEVEPMSVLVATAKTLLDQRITQAGEGQRR